MKEGSTRPDQKGIHSSGEARKPKKSMESGVWNKREGVKEQGVF